jgi:hypothetical protein
MVQVDIRFQRFDSSWFSKHICYLLLTTQGWKHDHNDVSFDFVHRLHELRSTRDTIIRQPGCSLRPLRQRHRIDISHIPKLPVGRVLSILYHLWSSPCLHSSPYLRID